MAMIPNLRRSVKPVTTAMTSADAKATQSFPYIDTLYDYGAFLGSASDGIGQIPPQSQKASIVIVGAGAGGLVAAYELLRSGAQNVTILESSGRIGGRTYSDTYGGAPSVYLAELGAMRFPPSEFGLFHYLDLFGIQATDDFPDPGRVLTDLGYQGQTYPWVAGQAPPAIFKTVQAGWSAFIENGFTVPNGPALAAPVAITQMLQDGTLDKAQAAWQAYIDYFGDKSFYTALREIFDGPNAPGGMPWNFPNDYELFGGLGVGSGGLGPMYPVAFLEIVRLIVDELETDQQFVPSGIESLTNALSAQSFGGQTIAQRVTFASVISIQRTGSNVTLGLGNGTTLIADRVIVTATTRAMQIDIGLTLNDTQLLPQQCTAVNGVHLTSSSKVFVLTQRKFWLDNNLPANIQTDTLVRGVYCLDYSPEDPNGLGVVLLSYAWEDDAIKQLALGDAQSRVTRLVADLAQTNAEFASFVVPFNDDYTNNVRIVDWDLEQGYYGAFKLNFAGDDELSQELFFQFQDSLNSGTDPKIYLAGDSCAFTGGWVEGAVQTALNAVCATIYSLDGTFNTPTNPLQNMTAVYAYGGSGSVDEKTR